MQQVSRKKSQIIFDPTHFFRALLKWFDQSRRDLPWRLPRDAAPDARLDPYYVLISEAMLQQTQVSTVVPYFQRFCKAFPTLQSLADADEQQVLRLWQGLGYYSRARNLQAAVRKILSNFDGQLPDTVQDLQSLPGVGRYTAGAIASIAFNRRAPILDGNVARVLCRIDRIESDPREPATRDLLWQRAEQMLPEEGNRVGDFNSALMELGATVCTPRNPQCLICPVRQFCRAFADGVQDRIPAPKKSRINPLEKRWTFCIARRSKAGEHWLIEQRPGKGRWAGMWQFVTLEATTKKPSPSILKSATNVSASGLEHAGQIQHSLTHRRYTFDVYTCQTNDGKLLKSDRPRIWVTLNDLDRYPLPRPHQKIVELLQNRPATPNKR
jgi:A/G-specific adenine glycosylase